MTRSQFAWNAPGLSSARSASCELFSVLDTPDQRAAQAEDTHEGSERRGLQLSRGGLGLTHHSPLCGNVDGAAEWAPDRCHHLTPVPPQAPQYRIHCDY